MAKLKPVLGATVVVRRDMYTRGGRWFRAGLKMKVISTSEGIITAVWVRGKKHWISTLKKEFDRNFEVVAVPNQSEEDE